MYPLLSDAEILRKYRMAGSINEKKNAITVMSELCCCSKEDIRKKLVELGIPPDDLPKKRQQKKQRLPTGVQIEPVRFSIPGAPQGKARPRVTRYGTYTPEATKMYEERVKRHYPGGKFDKSAMLEIEICAYFAIPKSTPKYRIARMLSGQEQPAKRPDWDNIGKMICDALNKVAYADDAQIVSAHVQKKYDLKPRVEVEIKEVKHE